MVRVFGLVIMIMIMVMIVFVPVVMRMFVGFLGMFIVAAIFRIAFGQIMMMKMKKALQEKHRKKTSEHPRNGAVERSQIFFGVGQEMEQGDAEHQARNEADGDLQAGVGEFDEQGQPTAGQRREKNEHTVNRQQPTGRNHAPEIFNLARKGESEKRGVWPHTSHLMVIPSLLFCKTVAMILTNG